MIYWLRIIFVCVMSLFAYQGIRMYGKLMKIDKDIPNQIIDEIKGLLLPKDGQNG